AVSALSVPGRIAVSGRVRRRISFASIALWGLGAGVAVAMLLPAAYLVVRSLDGPPEQFLRTLLRPVVARYLVNTLGLAGVTTFFACIIGVIGGWLTARADVPGAKVWTVLLSLPLAVPSYIGGYAYLAAFGPKTWIGLTLLEPLGLTVRESFWGAALLLTSLTYPYVLLPVRAQLSGMDPSLLEVARSLGLGPRETFIRVLLPLLRPAVMAGGLLVALYVISDFGAVAMLEFRSFTYVIFLEQESLFNRQRAAILSLLLVVLTLAILSAEILLRNRGRVEKRGVRTLTSRPRFPLGPWKGPALVFCGIVVTLGLVVPAGTVGYWFVKGLGDPTLDLSWVWKSTWDSVWASVLAAVASALAAIPVALLSVRRAGKASLLVERSTYTGFALPGIVVALALVYFSLFFPRQVASLGMALGLSAQSAQKWSGFVDYYQTLPVLIFAYVVLFLPQAVGSTRASLLQVPPNLEEAGRSLGRSVRNVFRTITLPLVFPGVLSGAALVFLTTMKELPATLLLSPIGFRPLAAMVFDRMEDAFFAEAAAPALILLLFSMLAMTLIVRREDS
ncbi:MAG: ABC transporter permease, partial [Nitrospinota bacterium]